MTIRKRTQALFLATALLVATGFVAAYGQQPAPASAAPPPSLTQAMPVDPQITQGQLPNGLRYYVRANKKPEKRAELRLVVKAGSILEDDDQRAKRELGPKKRATPRRAGDLTAESIRHIYAALVARAGNAGIERREAETPYEFLPRVTREWNEQSNEVRNITEAYVAVHYGEHEATQDEVGSMKKMWKRVEEKIRTSTKNTKGH